MDGIRRHHNGSPNLTPSRHRMIPIPTLVFSMMVIGLLVFWFYITQFGVYSPPQLPPQSTVAVLTPAPLVPRVRRWLDNYVQGFISDPEDPKHTYEQNLWYRYARHSASNNTNCYVCSRMPHSSVAPRVSIEPLAHPQSTCVLHMVAGKNEPTGYFNPSKPYNSSSINSCFMKGNYCEPLNCSRHLGNHPWVIAVPTQDDTTAQVAIVSVPDDIEFPDCCYFNGTTFLGNVSITQCTTVIFSNPKL